MAPADRKGGVAQGPGAARPFTCPHYDPVPGGKRCRQYLAGGACARPDEFMCIEWLKANGHVVPPPSRREDGSPELDLFGNPVEASPVAAPAPATDETRPPLPREPADRPEPPPVRALADEDVASFKALGVEVCIESEAAGPIWLVPDYTGADRKEISVEHAATLALICSVFPGSRVVSFEKTHDGAATPREGCDAHAREPVR